MPRRLYGIVGTILLLLIIPAKAIRWAGETFLDPTLVNVAPSLLGPAGLLFLALSSRGKISRLSLNRITLFVAALSVALEFAQLLPRPGILAMVHYAFDWFDIAATLVSIGVGYCIARRLATRGT